MSNFNRPFVLTIDYNGLVTYHYTASFTPEYRDQLEAHIGGYIWPIVSVNTASEAETLRVLFCQRVNPNVARDTMWFLPGFQGHAGDLPFAVNRFIDAYDQLRRVV